MIVTLIVLFISFVCVIGASLRSGNLILTTSKSVLRSINTFPHSHYSFIIAPVSTDTVTLNISILYSEITECHGSAV